MSKLKNGEDSCESTGQSGDGDSVTSEAEATNISVATTDALTRSKAAWNSTSPANDHCQSVPKHNNENLKSKFPGGTRNFTPFASAFLMYNRGHWLRPAAPVSREMADTIPFGQDEYPHIDMSAYEDYLKPIYKDGDVLLEIECGENKAMLYLSKLCQGSKGPCILFDDMWLTPNEFQYISGRETAKDWKRSIRHHGKSMKLLLSKGILAVHPPICDCEGCRISSPVNRCRLAEKRTAPPPIEKHLSKKKKILVIPSWSNLSQSLRISENERQRNHSENCESSSNDGDSSERTERLKSPDPEGKRESRLTVIIDQLLHNKKKGLQDENNSCKTIIAPLENPVIKEDLDSRDENCSEKTTNCFNSTTESEDSSNDMSSNLESPVNKQTTEDVKLDKTACDDISERTVFVTSEQDLSLPVKSEENSKTLTNSNNSNEDIQTDCKSECQEQNCLKIEKTKVKVERQSPIPTSEDSEVSETTATLLPPAAYLQTGSTHFNNHFHYLPYAHSHFFPVGLTFDKNSPTANYSKFSLKQLDMMSRNYSEYIRNLAAKYRPNGDGTMKIHEASHFFPNYEEYYRNHPFNFSFHLSGHGVQSNWTLENQFNQFYTDQQRLHSNMRMVELQSSPALTQLLKNSSTEGTTQTQTESQVIPPTSKRRRSTESDNNALDLSTDKKPRHSIKRTLPKTCEIRSSQELLPPQPNLRDLLGHNINEKIRDHMQSAIANRGSKFMETKEGTKPLSTTSNRDNNTLIETKSTVTTVNKDICRLIESKAMKSLKTHPINPIKHSSSLKVKASQACPNNPEVVNLSHWTVREVYSFVKSIPACTDYAEMFRDHSIDGSALPLLTEDHLMNNMGMKLGPALKLRAMIANKFGNCNKCLHCLHCHSTINSPEKRCASN